MNFPPAFDPEPLSWVRKEIDRALEETGKAWRREADDTAPDRFAPGIALAHQAQGALDMLGLAAPACVMASLETSLQALAAGRLALSPPLRASLEGALAAVRRHLDALLAGDPHPPPSLLPAYRELAAARGDATAGEDRDAGFADGPAPAAKPAPGPQEQLLLGQVARDIRNSLAQIEQALEAFFRAPAEKRELARLAGPLGQVDDALAALGQGAARRQLQQCCEQFQRFADPAYRPAQEDFEIVAHNLATLGYFIDSLPHCTIDFEQFARRLQPPPRQERESAAAPEAPASAFWQAPSSTLYDIFRAEARGHLDTLIAHCAQLEARPAAPTAFEMTRAAHTLGGIAATVGLLPINKLAIALERALLRRDGCARPDCREGLEAVRQALRGLEGMFAALAEHQGPQPRPALIAALAAIYPPAAEAAAAPPPPPPLPPDKLDAQLLPIFLEEAQDLARGFNSRLRTWRAAPADTAAPQALARLLHTFKGSARMAGAMRLGETTHALEARLQDILRPGHAGPLPFEEIESGCDLLTQAVDRLHAGLASAPSGAAGEEGPPEGESEGGMAPAILRVRAERIDRLVNDAGELSIARTRIEGEMRGLQGALRELDENVARLRRQLHEAESLAAAPLPPCAAPAQEVPAGFVPGEPGLRETLRCLAAAADGVAAVQQNLRRHVDGAHSALLVQARLNRGLQQELLGMRMLPFASQGERLHRLVRQTAREAGKRAVLEIRGGEVEIDRSVLDRMLPALEHMLRNAVTHGIESGGERAAAGKPEAGVIGLSLAQEGNEIVATLADDGRGLDAGRIRARAEEEGLVQPGAAIDDAWLFDLIFRPGFSTADQITRIAGRGIGMDVVRTEVAHLGGRIETASRPGRGTTFRLYLPLTLAVAPTLVVQAGGHTCAIPSGMVEQVLNLKPQALAPLLEKGEAEWQGRRYPLHFLPHLLGEAAVQPEARRRHWVLLLRSGRQHLAVQVDALRGNQEVVVKNIGPQLARVAGLAGATVLGDGRVVLILNPLALAERAFPSAPPAAAPPEEPAG